MVGLHIMWPRNADTAAAGIEPGLWGSHQRARFRGFPLGPQPQHDDEQLGNNHADGAEAPERPLPPVHLREVRETAFSDYTARVQREEDAHSDESRQRRQQTKNGAPSFSARNALPVSAEQPPYILLSLTMRGVVSPPPYPRLRGGDGGCEGEGILRPF